MYFIFHVTMMVAGLLAFASGVAAAMFFRKKRWWLQYHRRAGTTGTICLLVGFLFSVVMLASDAERHFKVIHSQLGAITVLAACTNAVIGRLQFVIKTQVQRLRPVHRWLGRAVLLMMLIVIILGLFTAGIL
jgi:amino acid transporter